MFIDFKDKNVLITGGSRGIGRACAKLFAELNANVIITYKTNVDEAEQTIKVLKQGGNHSSFQLDISQPDAVKTFFDKVMNKYDRLDVLVNNAGVFVEHNINEVS